MGASTEDNNISDHGGAIESTGIIRRLQMQRDVGLRGVVWGVMRAP